VLVENRLALVGVVTAAVAVVFFVVGVREVTRQQFPERPDLSKTPGVAETLPMDVLCSPRPALEVPAAVRKSVFDHYGIDRPKAEDYELDFLIPSSLGGTADPKNLWAEPLKRLEWNAHIKNALEQHLHEQVCNGTIPLDEAQKALTKDWIAAYQQYFHVRLPLTKHLHR
jgi:hypothetical protein